MRVASETTDFAPCFAVTIDDRGVMYRGCATDGADGAPWTSRWARIIHRDGLWGAQSSCWDVELSDGTRFGGEMSFAFVDTCCLRWVGWGEG